MVTARVAPRRRTGSTPLTDAVHQVLEDHVPDRREVEWADPPGGGGETPKRQHRCLS